MPIPLAFNYSREAAALLEAGLIAIDRWKCPPWPELIAEARQSRPVYVHFDLYAGGGHMEAIDWSVVERMMDETSTPFVNLHLTPTLADFGFSNEPLTAAQNAQVLETMMRDVGFVARRFGSERVIVENIPYRGKPERNGWEFVRATVEPAVFTQVLTETGTGLLFDIAHATITANTLNINVRDYITAHPLNRLRELHIGGVRSHQGDLEDHLAMTDTDWRLFEEMLGLIAVGRAAKPWLVACEYGGLGENFAWRSETVVIAEDAVRMKAMLEFASR